MRNKSALLPLYGMWLVYRWRGFLWHTAGVAHSGAWLVQGEGRVRGWVRWGGAGALENDWSNFEPQGVELSVAPGSKPLLLPKTAFLRECVLLYYMWTWQTYTIGCVCTHTCVFICAYSHIFVVFSRCSADGRIYMASKTGSYYQYPLTRVYFSVHLHVYSPVNREAKFILRPLHHKYCLFFYWDFFLTWCVQNFSYNNSQKSINDKIDVGQHCSV